MTRSHQTELSLGPVLFKWPAEQWRDFYFQIADEAPVKRVYIGEVVCSKRTPFIEPLYDEVIERLQKAGKDVVFSTLAQITIKRDRKLIKEAAQRDDIMVEANDTAALPYLQGRVHMIGPYINVYNESALSLLAKRGATHICTTPEVPPSALAVLIETGRAHDVTVETQVFGRMPLALSARCYSARAHERIKDNCQFICDEDPDGKTLSTMEGQPLVTINGIQTLSYTCLNLAREAADLRDMGVSLLRISPHSAHTPKVCRIFDEIVQGHITGEEALDKLAPLSLDMPFANGFYYRRPGYEWLDKKAA